ncbi:hypothetical protein ACQJBY_010625 [Aegilops geniculata]
MPITQFWVTPSIYLTKARGPGPRLDLWDIEAALVLSGWPNKMRKELNSERKGDDNDHEGQDNDEASVSKKQRVVWSEAVPKRILQLMNVEKFPRENIASHLQILRFLCHPELEARNHITLPASCPSMVRLHQEGGYSFL